MPDDLSSKREQEAFIQAYKHASAPPAPDTRIKINSSRELYAQCDDFKGDGDKEHSVIWHLGPGGVVLKRYTVHMGRPGDGRPMVADLFRAAVREGAMAIAVVHNHCNGDPTPTDGCKDFAMEMAAAGTLLDIPVADNLIVTADGYVSLHEVLSSVVDEAEVELQAAEVTAALDEAPEAVKEFYKTVEAAAKAGGMGKINKQTISKSLIKMYKQKKREGN